MTLAPARYLCTGPTDHINIRAELAAIIPAKGYESLQLKADLFAHIRGIMVKHNLVTVRDAGLALRQVEAQIEIENFLLSISTDIMRANPQH